MMKRTSAGTKVQQRNKDKSTGHKKGEERTRIPVIGKDVRCAIDQPYVKNAKSAE